MKKNTGPQLQFVDTAKCASAFPPKHMVKVSSVGPVVSQLYIIKPPTVSSLLRCPNILDFEILYSINTFVSFLSL